MEDHELLAKIQNPDSKNYGFNLLVRKYQEKIYGHIRKMVIDHNDADDLTQEVFLKVYKNIASFRKDAQLFTWIYRIATNECLAFLNKKKRFLFLPISDFEQQLSNKIDSNILLSGDDIELKLLKALLKLPAKQRMVFNMKYFDELKYTEIAEITNTSVGALKASYHLAVKKIEDILNTN